MNQESLPATRRPPRYLLALLIMVSGALAAFLVFKGRSSESAPAAQPTAVDLEDASTSRRTLDDAIRIAKEELARMERELFDYRGRIVKRERINGVLGDEQEMLFKIRTRRAPSEAQPQPMAVYLRFLRPASAAGREVIWAEGANDGKMVAHEAGLAGLFKVYLDPTGFFAMQGNLHPISEIGFKNLVHQLIGRGELLAQIGGADVTFVEDHYVGGRPCLLIQVRPRELQAKGIDTSLVDFRLAEIAIDQERGVPLRYAAYGIPPEGETEMPLLEEYTYLDVELNVGLDGSDFDPDNPEYEFP